jgi:branched-chain amino acid transport system ATP-binding protein
VLSVDGVEAGYGLLRAVRNASFEVDEGETVALVGANGAGKSTLLRTIAGAHRPSHGRIVFNGLDVTAMPAYRRVRSGLALVPEGRRLFPELTVEENLLVGKVRGRDGPWDVHAVVEAFPMLARVRNHKAHTLSGGEQQAAAIGRALMANPRLLLVDEVSLGLAPMAVDAVYASLRALIDHGTSLLLVEQNLRRALGFADRVLCLLEGALVLAGRAADLTRDQITAAYFGLRSSAPA